MVFGSLTSFAMAYRLQQQRQRQQQQQQQQQQSNNHNTPSTSSSNTYHLYAQDEEAPKILSIEEMHHILSQNENTHMFNYSNILKRVDTSSYAANDPIEDRSVQLYSNDEAFIGGMCY
jgi:hypothetical protein